MPHLLLFLWKPPPHRLTPMSLEEETPGAHALCARKAKPCEDAGSREPWTSQEEREKQELSQRCLDPPTSSLQKINVYHVAAELTNGH